MSVWLLPHLFKYGYVPKLYMYLYIYIYIYLKNIFLWFLQLFYSRLNFRDIFNSFLPTFNFTNQHCFALFHLVFLFQ